MGDVGTEDREVMEEEQRVREGIRGDKGREVRRRKAIDGRKDQLEENIHSVRPVHDCLRCSKRCHSNKS